MCICDMFVLVHKCWGINITTFWFQPYIYNFSFCDCSLKLMEYDLQLGLVEFAVPLVQIAGSVVFFLGILFVFNQVNIFIIVIISLTLFPCAF